MKNDENVKTEEAFSHIFMNGQSGFCTEIIFLDTSRFLSPISFELRKGKVYARFTSFRPTGLTTATTKYKVHIHQFKESEIVQFNMSDLKKRPLESMDSFMFRFFESVLKIYIIFFEKISSDSL